jgi:lysine-specific demethylase 8
MKTIPIDRIPADSPEAAERVRRSEPFVTRLRWPAHDRWTLEYVKQRCGPRQVIVFRKRDPEPAEELELALPDYLDLVAAPDWGSRYELLGIPQTRIWLDGAPDPGLGALLDDLTVPALVDRDRLQSINLWLQGGGYDNGNHYDPNGLHNLNVQIRGRKRWRLFHPDLGGVLGVEPALADLAPPLVSSQTRHPDRCGDQPGHADARCLEAVLEPGDAIFVPAFYMHWVVHERDLHVNVNFWWAPRSVPMAGIPVAWALLNGLISVFRRRMPGASLGEVCAAIAATSAETRELLLELERALLTEPELLTPARAMSLRRGTGSPLPAEGVERKFRDRA